MILSSITSNKVKKCLYEKSNSFKICLLELNLRQKLRAGKLSSLAENLRTLLSEVKISERELSRRTGVVQPVIHRLLNGITQNPTLETVQALANYFLVSVSELTGEIPLKKSAEGRQSLEHNGWNQVPILANSQIGSWLATSEITADLLKNIPVDFVPNKKTFAFELVNDAMSPIFYKKDLVIVDPTKELKSGKYVLVQGQDEMEVKQLIIEESGLLMTKSLANPTAEPTKTDMIVGTVIQSKRVMED